jgi:hypothetical protein
MKTTLENDQLEITIKSLGAEMTSIKAKKGRHGIPMAG